MTEAPDLAELLAAMFASAAGGQPVSRVVARGLHLKASVRESGRRELLLWCASGLPSKKNCATVSQGAGFIEPKFQPWTCEGKDGFHIRDLADWQHLCTHEWDGVMFLSGRTEGGTSRTCKRCGTDAMVTHKKRAKHSTFLYNGHEVSETLYARITVAGPMPSTLDAEARAALISEMTGEKSAVTSRLVLQGAVCGLCRHGQPDWDLHRLQPGLGSPRTARDLTPWSPVAAPLAALPVHGAHEPLGTQAGGMSLKPPNYTQVPNEVFGLLPVMADTELRVTLVIVRDTFGWQQPGAATELSLSELVMRTGLSKQGVVNGLKAGQERGTIYQLKGSGGMKSAYGLVVNSVDRSTELTSPLSRPLLVNSVDRDSQLSRPRVVNSVDRLTPDQAAPSEEKTEAERKLKEKEKKGKKVVVAAGAFSEPDSQTTATSLQETNTENGSGASAELRMASVTHQVDSQAPQQPEASQTTSNTDVPGAGGARAALRRAFNESFLVQLLGEFEDRPAWLELPPQRIDELLRDARLAQGSKYKTALITALDDAARAARARAAPMAAAVAGPVKPKISARTLEALNGGSL